MENAGRIPTPALISHAITQQSAGVMVTGSHIPFDRNGIKINKSVGEVLKSDEAGIIGAVERVRADEYARSAAASLFDAGGMLTRAPDLPPLDGAAEAAYARRYVNCFDRGSLAGMRVLVYQHSAVGRDLLPRILRELGAAVAHRGTQRHFHSYRYREYHRRTISALRRVCPRRRGRRPGRLCYRLYRR